MTNRRLVECLPPNGPVETRCPERVEWNAAAVLLNLGNSVLFPGTTEKPHEAEARQDGASGLDKPFASLRTTGRQNATVWGWYRYYVILYVLYSEAVSLDYRLSYKFCQQCSRRISVLFREAVTATMYTTTLST